MTLLKGDMRTGHISTYGLPLYTIDSFLSMDFLLFQGIFRGFLFSPHPVRCAAITENFHILLDIRHAA
jgi:hypothetical protein